jgi:hypothetical protein
MIDASTNIAVSSQVADFYLEYSGRQAEESTAGIEKAMVLCGLRTGRGFRATTRLWHRLPLPKRK